MEEALPQSTGIPTEALQTCTRRDSGSPPPNPLDLLRKEGENPNIFHEREAKRQQAEDEVHNDEELTKNKPFNERWEEALFDSFNSVSVTRTLDAPMFCCYRFVPLMIFTKIFN